jgi:hypothetical protein
VRLSQSQANRIDISLTAEFLDRLAEQFDAGYDVGRSVAMRLSQSLQQTFPLQVTGSANKLHFSAWAMSGRPMLRREWDPTIPHVIQPCAADPDRANVDLGKDFNLGKQPRSQLKVFRLHLLFQKSDNVFQDTNSVYDRRCSGGPDRLSKRRKVPKRCRDKIIRATGRTRIHWPPRGHPSRRVAMRHRTPHWLLQCDSCEASRHAGRTHHTNGLPPQSDARRTSPRVACSFPEDFRAVAFGIRQSKLELPVVEIE